MIVVTLLAIQCGGVMWLIHDREVLIKERDEARSALRDARHAVEALEGNVSAYMEAAEKADRSRIYAENRAIKAEVELKAARSPPASATKP